MFLKYARGVAYLKATRKGGESRKRESQRDRDREIEIEIIKGVKL